jgi:hypothetical protein
MITLVIGSLPCNTPLVDAPVLRPEILRPGELILSFVHLKVPVDLRRCFLTTDASGIARSREQGIDGGDFHRLGEEQLGEDSGLRPRSRRSIETATRPTASKAKFEAATIVRPSRRTRRSHIES